MSFNQNIENYWKNIDDHLVELLKIGYCYLPPVNMLFDINDYSDRILRDTKNSTFNENNLIHKEIINKYGFDYFLTTRLYEIAREKLFFKGDIDNQYHIVRNVDHTKSSESYRGHFDSHLFTLIIPTCIPKDKNGNVCGGDLMFFPNIRKQPKLELSNILQKIYYKKFNSKSGFKKLSQKSNLIHEDFSEMQPLLFLGTQTYHANLPLTSKTRQTLLSHFFDPSPKWGAGNILRKIRNR